MVCATVAVVRVAVKLKSSMRQAEKPPRGRKCIVLTQIDRRTSSHLRESSPTILTQITSRSASKLTYPIQISLVQSPWDWISTPYDSHRQYGSHFGLFACASVMVCATCGSRYPLRHAWQQWKTSTGRSQVLCLWFGKCWLCPCSSSVSKRWPSERLQWNEHWREGLWFMRQRSPFTYFWPTSLSIGWCCVLEVLLGRLGTSIGTRDINWDIEIEFSGIGSRMRRPLFIDFLFDLRQSVFEVGPCRVLWIWKRGSLCPDDKVESITS